MLQFLAHDVAVNTRPARKVMNAFMVSQKAYKFTMVPVTPAEMSRVNGARHDNFRNDLKIDSRIPIFGLLSIF